MWRQDGRSASMTAPNGPSQQACILQSMREVSTSASSFQVNCSVQFTGFTRETVWKITFEAGNKARDINLAECHGTGGMCFFLLTLSEVSSLKTNPMETTGARKTTRPFNLSLPWGTALGDPIEVGALKNVMEPRDTTLALTSSKSNIGHLEGSAGASQFLWLGDENWRFFS